MQCGSQREWKWNEEKQKIGGGKRNKVSHEKHRGGTVHLDEGRKLVLWSTFGLTASPGLASSLNGSFIFSALSYFCCHPGEHIYKVGVKVHRI